MLPRTLFEDRREAGARLAEALAKLSLHDPVVLALPRGGVPVAYEIAERLDAPLDVLVVRKLGVPGHEELAMGAIASGGVLVRNRDVIGRLQIDDDVIERVRAREQRELERRERMLRGERPPLPVRDRSVIVVDDGLATGATMRAAAESLRERGPRAVIVAVPVGASSSCEMLAGVVDRLVVLERPEPFYGVGLWYADFEQVSDDEVRRLLAQHEQKGR